MERTITVCGVGNASFKPDTIVINVTLFALDKDYNTAMSIAQKQLDAVRQKLVGAGIAEDGIRTADFSVRAEKKGEHDKSGNYVQRFVGYKCTHLLKVTFGFDTELLGRALGALADSGADPELEILFTVKDKVAAQNAVITAAAKTAVEKAKLLAAAGGVKLGELVKIDYRVSEADAVSPTRYLACNAVEARATGIDITPEDVKVSDSVVFTWTLLL